MISAVLNLLRWIGPRTVVAAVCVVGLELGLYHIGNYGKWIVQEQSARYGWRMLPNQNGWSREYDVREQTNDHGFRDDRDWGARPAHALAPDPQQVRIAVVGNSMTYGTSVPVGQTWARVLEDQLNAEFARRGDGRTVTVMNFAVQGYTLEQMARLYDDEISLWRPNLVVWPTISADTRPMRPAADEADYGFRRSVIRTATYEMLRDRIIDKWIPPPGRNAPELGPRELKREFWNRLIGPLEAELRAAHGSRDEGVDELWLELTERLRKAFDRSPPATVVRAVWHELDRPTIHGAGVALGIDLGARLWTVVEDNLPMAIWELLDGNQKRTPFAPAQQFLWRLRAARLAGICQDLTRHAGGLALVVLPNMHMTVTPDAPPPSAFWLSWGRDPGLANLEVSVIDAAGLFRAPMAELAEVLRRDGFAEGPRGQDIIGADTEHVEQSLFLLGDTGHYNSAGHGLLAGTIFRQLLDNGALDRILESGMVENSTRTPSDGDD